MRRSGDFSTWPTWPARQRSYCSRLSTFDSCCSCSNEACRLDSSSCCSSRMWSTTPMRTRTRTRPRLASLADRVFASSLAVLFAVVAVVAVVEIASALSIFAVSSSDEDDDGVER